MTQPTLFTFIFFLTNLLVSGKHIPTTLQGPFHPRTIRFDPSLRRGSDDIPMDDPRLKKNVTSMFPEQIALALSTPTSMWVSWVTGDAQIGPNVTALDPTSVASEVWYGKESGNYSSKKRGNATVYSQLYPFEGLFNYTSAIIHHVRIDGLEPETKYYYRCGDSSLPAMSEEHVFETLPLPAQNSYPRRIAVIGDLGLTRNSSTTIDHLSKNNPSLILMVGDLTYANQYLTTGGKGVPCFSCAFPDAPIRETYQPRWDGWGRFMEPLVSRVPMMVIEGNHEIEPQAAGITFKSYLTRFAVPAKESGSNSNFYYSFDAGGVHFIMLGAYVDYNSTGENGMLSFMFGCKFCCSKQNMEQQLLHHLNSRSSICLAKGRLTQSRSNSNPMACSSLASTMVHAYERMNRVYNYTLDACGPIYITVGDGGNIEKVDVDHADEPGKCPSQGDNMPEIGGVCHLNFSSGPAKGNFCWDRQPEWSAYRESSFGHGILEVLNSTYALWSWHRNQDTYKEDSPGDQIYIVRQPDICSSSTSLKVISYFNIYSH
ncbi:purple acid phosphatase 23 isoform X2 [Gossypium australe]|uniref:Purple acid phosphatase n=1 Tax=Gossypium australe TaxID=47621 RepID=A0A5B6WHB4_9ROSI|nr:purple acid phosphatase 23 isoform X2 [Gossypium australe]